MASKINYIEENSQRIESANKMKTKPDSKIIGFESKLNDNELKQAFNFLLTKYPKYAKDFYVSGTGYICWSFNAIHQVGAKENIENFNSELINFINSIRTKNV